MSDPGPVLQRDTLQDLALAQCVRQSSYQPAQRLIEPFRVLPKQDQPEDAPIQDEASDAERGNREEVNRQPCGDCAEYIVWGDHP